MQAVKHVVGDRVKEAVQGVEKIENLSYDSGGIVQTKDGHVCAVTIKMYSAFVSTLQ